MLILQQKWLYLCILCSNPLSQALYLEIKTLRNLLWANKVKTLKSQLLKKPSLEIFQILDLYSPNIKKNICFILHAVTFFLQFITEGKYELVTYILLTPNRPLVHTSFTYPKLNMDGFSILNGFLGYIHSTQKIFLKFLHAGGLFQTSWFTS